MNDVNLPIRRLLYPLTREDKANFKKSSKLRLVILEIIRQRQSDTRQYNDLLDLLLNARYEDTGEAMSEDQIIDEVLILLFAGMKRLPIHFPGYCAMLHLKKKYWKKLLMLFIKLLYMTV